jgi:hypothetical protein
MTGNRLDTRLQEYEGTSFRSLIFHGYTGMLAHVLSLQD